MKPWSEAGNLHHHGWRPLVSVCLNVHRGVLFCQSTLFFQVLF
uniref:Uncharacterized protein n=1 Tax=Anguilla anguilla TaxID=7936 RepID=A0A0E9RLI6_ANGAN